MDSELGTVCKAHKCSLQSLCALPVAYWVQYALSYTQTGTPHQSKEVKTEAESVRDEIKQEMLTQDTEELEAGQYIIRWTSVLTNRFDTTAFKKVLPDVYKAYTKQITSRRFTIA